MLIHFSPDSDSCITVLSDSDYFISVFRTQILSSQSFRLRLRLRLTEEENFLAKERNARRNLIAPCCANSIALTCSHQCVCVCVCVCMYNLTKTVKGSHGVGSMNFQIYRYTYTCIVAQLDRSLLRKQHRPDLLTQTKLKSWHYV
jgi:hypothetical protein